MNKKKLNNIFCVLVKCEILLIIILFISCADGITPPLNKEISRSGFCLSFDDSYTQEWNKIIPLLDSNDVKATFFITQIHKISNEGIVVLKNLKDRGHEIGCHGWNHIDALKFLESNNLESYLKSEIEPAINFMTNNELAPRSFSYPYGFNCDSLDNFLLESFCILRDVTDEQRKPLEKQIEDIDEIYFASDKQKVIAGLGIDKNFNISLEMIEEGFKRASNNNEVIVFYCHKPVEKISGTYQIEYKYLIDLFELAKKYNLKSYTFSELAQ